MTAAGTRVSRAPAAPPGGSRLAGLRLVRLHLASRRVPAALAALAACAAVLQVMLHSRLGAGAGDGAGAPLQLPLLLETAAASVIAITAGSPFGDPERATGRWLPYLRLAAATALTAAAVGALVAGTAAVRLPGGDLDVLRNVAGLTGIGLLCAAVLGGPLAWIGPLAYLAIAEYGLTGVNWPTPWIWPARPPHDLGAALCAGLVLAAGLAAITVRGARDRG